ncbi:N-acetylmuramoyl-L-alanine amidase family protein [Clostridium saccharobutylicum]|uniref:Surface protein PspC n=1 Tax=Clostridium saccharobutylicum DSM 13864 TaxID=1345695 RepID=U5N059_CLOSA|nr:N-acetylmuramoyl-L-alanine amidase family protein [Clostridium saccharobutylicum]AGX45172.1 surface protein PspC [Clostridium saccharobutylicum DSM 13864]AQR92450.1 autolysin [Clostridium saccharobutylicum]AQS02353.1 autolysin [Clostridium saccharobutylicum]AQS11957.1 autolysin [Clostridium saccharobutylicum]AQS16336.1 autolysin [Clostridium saccharobutylicum]
MKNLKLRKLVAVALTVAAISTVSPVGASAAWKQNSTGWWNTEGDSYSTGWRAIDGKWYYFDSTGYMKTGWINDGSAWYFADASGAMKTGWVLDGSTWYYTNASGAMKTGWVLDGSTWYYTNASGAMQTGWVNYNGNWYFTASNGAMKTGWVNDNGTWYFTSVSGAMQTGVVEVDGKVYYLAASGAMQTGQVTINGVVYTFAASGEATGDNIPTPDKGFSSSGISQTPNTTGSNNSSSSSRSSGSSGAGHHKSSSSYAINAASGYNKITKKSDDTYSARANADGMFRFTIDNKSDDNSYFYATNEDGTDVNITADKDGMYAIDINAGASNVIVIKEIVRSQDAESGVTYKVLNTYKLTVTK